MNTEKNGLMGKVAVITGAGGVICSHFAKTLAGFGVKIALLDRNEQRAYAFAKGIVESGGCARAYACDVLNKQNCMDVADRVAWELGNCDILINGAGGNHPDATTQDEFFDPNDVDSDTKTFFMLDEDKIRAVMDLNFMGTLIPTQAFAKQMVSKGGSIINISSMNAYTPLTKIPAYSGAKSAVSNFTQWLAVYFSKVGIRVNAIAPGFFSTAQNAKLLWNDDGTPTERTKKILMATPMGRFGECSELDGALTFLANTEKSAFVTGVVIPVDGGFSAYSGV